MSKTQQPKTVVSKVGTAGPINPFAKRETPSMNAGTVAVEESRAVAEAMGKLYIAKKYPRDEAAAFDKLMESCARPSMAESAEFAYPKGGKSITGPSIRLAEEMARLWGNLDYGIRELSEDEDGTEMQAYCWDLETNLMSSQNFRVKKERSTKEGGYKLTDQRDIYEQNANLGSRRLRARILAVLPTDLKEAALAQCRLTLTPKKEELPQRVKDAVAQFATLKVTSVMLETRYKKKLAEFTADDFTELVGIYNSLKESVSRPQDWFEGVKDSTPATDGAAGDLNKAIQGQ